MRVGSIAFFVGVVLVYGVAVFPADTPRDYSIDGTISREILENYLSRSVTHLGLCCDEGEASSPEFLEDLRMLKAIGAKFILESR